MTCTTDKPYGNGCLQIISSNCVSWQGDVNTDLSVCVGDTLSSVVNTILTKINTITDGTSITVDLENLCSAINTALIGKDFTVQNVLQALTDVLCDVITDVTTLQTNQSNPVTFLVSCLSEGGGTNTAQPINQTIQILIDEVCWLRGQLENITDELNNNDLTTTVNNSVGNYILTAISACGQDNIIKNGTGSSATLKFTGFVPYYSPIPYIGPLNWFDNTGAGLEQYGMCGWFILNGLNSTPNWLGYTFAGATNLPGITTTTLDSAVSNPLHATAAGDKRGEVVHTLITSELPSHNHSVTDPGHTHSITGDVVSTGTVGGATTVVDKNTLTSSASLTYNNKVKSNTTGITIANTGSDGAHENRQPTVYGVWIYRKPYQRIP